MLTLEIRNQSGSRINHKGSPRDKEKIRLGNFNPCLCPHPLVKTLAIENDIGFDDSSAFFAMGNDRLGIRHVFPGIKGTTVKAVIPMDGPMQLKDSLASCPLVKAIDVLCDNIAKLSCLLQFGKLIVTSIRLLI